MQAIYSLLYTILCVLSLMNHHECFLIIYSNTHTISYTPTVEIQSLFIHIELTLMMEITNGTILKEEHFRHDFLTILHYWFLPMIYTLIIWQYLIYPIFPFFAFIPEWKDFLFYREKYQADGRKLGEGGFGSVQLVTDVRSGHLCAAKFIRKKNVAREEVRILADLNNDYIIRWLLG